MGEPLEVPQQQQQQHSSSEDWDSHQSVTHTRSYGNKAGGPRRTRHRVDAGEPRGCFNTTSPQFYPRNIFTSPSGFGSSTSSPLFGGPINHHSQQQQQHQQQQHSQSQQHSQHHHSPGSNSTSAVSSASEAYYFQPMKMLSEFITTTAAAAAAAAGSSPPTSNTTATNPYASVSVPHQLLLREMLQKSGRNSSSNNNNNNNNNNTKCGYEEEVVTVEEGCKQENSNSSEIPPTADGQAVVAAVATASAAGVGIGIVTSGSGAGDSGSLGANENNKSTDQQHQHISQMRINGCKKRKLYQPQRSEFDEAEDELDDDDYDAATAATTTEATSGGEEQEKEDGELMLDEDEEEMRDRERVRERNQDIREIRESERERERERVEREHGNSLATAAAAPLTRQLLTERAQSSIISEQKISPSKYLTNHMDTSVYVHQWKESFKSTLITHISDLVDTQFALLCPPGGAGGGGGGDGRIINSASAAAAAAAAASAIALATHQGGLAGLAGRLTPSHHHNHHHHNNNNINQMKSSPNSNVDLHHHSHHHHHNSSGGNPQKNSALNLLNGGTVHNNNNSIHHNNNSTNNNNNHSTRDKMSPELVISKQKYLGAQSIRNSTADFINSAAFPRFPFQTAVGAGKPPSHFSSALVGLSQAAHLQQQAAVAAAVGLQDMQDMDGPLSLVVTPKKKRHKVTDTRLTPRAVSRLLGQVDAYGDSAGTSPNRSQVSPPMSSNPQQLQIQASQSSIPVSLPTSVAIPNPSLSESRLFTPYAPLFHHPGAHHPHHRLDSPPMGQSIIHPALLANPAEYVQQLRAEMREQARNGDRERERERERERNEVGSAGSDSGETNSFADMPGAIFSCNSSHSSSTLTPMHLRKAKLMFFWVRYPSSAVLKMYFPDIKFNKNNTAQLVKWFSNFREFYYIQMEKYARQALSEGIKNAEDLHVSVDNELYRVLNLHYNRNNHIEVPSNFRYVVEQTLREFFKAIQTGKDSEQSWKKAIYKIIARLDDPVPEYFKSPNFLEQLE